LKKALEKAVKSLLFHLNLR